MAEIVPIRRRARARSFAEKNREVFGVLGTALALLISASLVSYHPSDPSFLHALPNDSEVHNFIGPVGAHVAELLITVFGLPSLFLPVWLFGLSWMLLVRPSMKLRRSISFGRLVGLAMVFATLSPFLILLLGDVVWRGVALPAGGAYGVLVVDVLTSWGSWPRLLVLTSLFLVGWILAVPRLPAELIAAGRNKLEELNNRFLLIQARRQKARQQRSTLLRIVSQQSAARSRPIVLIFRFS